MAREIGEELSVDVVVDGAALLGVLDAQAHGHPAAVVVRMTCQTAPYRGVLAPAAVIEEMAWITFADRLRSAPGDHLIFEHLHASGLLGN